MSTEPGSDTAPDPGTVVVLSPPPTPNGPLHLGHLSGPYVAADIAVRAARRRGERVLSVCGMDDNQNYVLAKARANNRDADALRDHYAHLIHGVFDRVGVTHDVFVEPATDPGYREGVLRLLDELVAAGALPIAEWEVPACRFCSGTLHHAYVTGACPGCGVGSSGGTCENCGGYTPAADLRDPHCTRCGTPATARATVRGPVLRMEDHREALLRTWSTASIPATVRRLLGRLLARPLPTIPVSYPSDWGYPAPAGHRLDVWVEMGLGYLHTIGRHHAPGARTLAGYRAGWARVREVWAFLGLDNAFYYVAMFPALYAAAGLDPAVCAGLVVNEFYTLDGAKFSTSRNHAVWAHELLAEHDPALVRAFLSWDRPAPHPTDFTMARFLATTATWRAGNGATVEPTELARAEQALTLPHFDAALAARLLLGRGDPSGLAGLLTGVPVRS